MRLAVIALLVVAGGCAGSDDPAVTMTSDHAFDPASLTVAAGTTITFTNDDDEAHTVTAYQDQIPDGGDYFSSGGFRNEARARADVGKALIEPGGDYSVTLEEPGTYGYFCIPHEQHGMKAEIVVEE